MLVLNLRGVAAAATGAVDHRSPRRSKRRARGPHCGDIGPKSLVADLGLDKGKMLVAF